MAGENEEKKEGAGPWAAAAALGEVVGALQGTEKELSRWEKREAERDAQQRAELESLHRHRETVDRENKRSNDLYEEHNLELKRHFEKLEKNDDERMELIRREVTALESIAKALNKG